MDFHVTLARPDGTPLGEDEVPAQGTLLVLDVTGSGKLGQRAVLNAQVIGWVPGSQDPMARSMLMGTCKALNSRADFTTASDS